MQTQPVLPELLKTSAADRQQNELIATQLGCGIAFGPIVGCATDKIFTQCGMAHVGDCQLKLLAAGDRHVHLVNNAVLNQLLPAVFLHQ